MIKEFSKKSEKSEKWDQWEHFRVIKKFTIFPLRIYQYSSQRTWWSWLSTTYILQSWEYSACYDDFAILNKIKVYFFGGYYENSRISNLEEYEEYKKYKLNKLNIT